VTSGDKEGVYTHARLQKNIIPLPVRGCTAPHKRRGEVSGELLFMDGVSTGALGFMGRVWGGGRIANTCLTFV
jgi:hypothetical protein